jgi:hypothetical protein
VQTVFSNYTTQKNKHKEHENILKIFWDAADYVRGCGQEDAGNSGTARQRSKSKEDNQEAD